MIARGNMPHRAEFAARLCALSVSALSFSFSLLSAVFRPAFEFVVPLFRATPPITSVEVNL
jgi:hypothetical protein